MRTQGVVIISSEHFSTWQVGRKIFGITLILMIGWLVSSCGQTEPGSKTAPSSDKGQQHSVEKMSYWDQQRKGANYFNEVPTEEWFDAAAESNIYLIRLAYDKWKGKERDFLMGNADDYKGLVKEDLSVLMHFLDYAQGLNQKIVISPLGLPGARFIQNNDGKRDGRLWRDYKYWDMSIQFWTDLAVALKGHPAVAGFDLINEPCPEVFHSKPTFWDKGFETWYSSMKNTPADLNQFYRRSITAIRSADRDVPIVVASGLYATPWAFEYLEPVEDSRIIYSFHMYEPYEYTTNRINNGQFTYPGEVTVHDGTKTFQMDRENQLEFLEPVIEWAEAHNIPQNRIWVAEFGCDRRNEGVDQYLGDLVSIFNQMNWHWSFYSFREDVWDAMDYELGLGKPPYKYWEYQDSARLHHHYEEIYTPTAYNEIWKVFMQQFESE